MDEAERLRAVERGDPVAEQTDQPVLTEVPGELCYTCAYWKAVSRTEGQCRCNPPVLLMWKGTPTFGAMSGWPTCRYDDWCGRWRDKDVAPEA